MNTVHLLIKGKVQGVFFRASAKAKAVSLGLQGWVRNTPDGCVESIAQGSDEQLKQFIDWCRHGPKAAVVTSVEIGQTEAEACSGFGIL